MKLQLFHICPFLAVLVLLLSSPGGLALPHHPVNYLSRLEGPEWEEALLRLQTWLGAPEEVGGIQIQPWPLTGEPGRERGTEELLARLQGLGTSLGWGTTGVFRGQREELDHMPMGPFPQHPMESVHYQQGGSEHEGEGGEKRNEALTSIAGGLQAFNRQKGGFGFRFGRK